MMNKHANRESMLPVEDELRILIASGPRECLSSLASVRHTRKPEFAMDYCAYGCVEILNSSGRTPAMVVRV
jgi:hypothetical protein